MATVGRGGQIRLTVQFYEYAGGPAYNADEIDGHPQLEIQMDGVTIDGPFTYDDDVVRNGIGSYYYVYTVPDDAAVANGYVALWTGTIHGAPATGTEYFDVVSSGSAYAGTGSAATLQEDQELVFLSGADPMYVDPDELKDIFPDARPVEIIEFIYYYSLEVKAMQGLDDDDVPTPTGIEYVKAATACSLSRIYDWGGVGDETSMKLGDLSVINRAFPKQTVKRSNATTWCELAAVLREEMVRGKSGIKAIVRGSNYPNPIPERRLRRIEK